MSTTATAARPKASKPTKGKDRGLTPSVKPFGVKLEVGMIVEAFDKRDGLAKGYIERIDEHGVLIVDEATGDAYYCDHTEVRILPAGTRISVDQAALIRGILHDLRMGEGVSEDCLLRISNMVEIEVKKG